MMKTKGKIIVIDGTDGCGKATQARMLCEYLQSQKKKAVVIDFPRYTDNFWGANIARALRGEYGDFLSVSPYIACPLYALDRWESKPQIEKFLAAGYTVIFDRYVSANMIHQAAKLKSTAEQNKLLAWLDTMEHTVMGIPRPDTVIFLDVPTAVSQKLLIQSAGESKHAYRKGKKDLHESNIDFQKHSRKTGLRVAKKYGWNIISCVRGSLMKSREEIAMDILKAL